MTVLFVGAANAARSPLAEALARKLVPQNDYWSAGAHPSHVRPEVREVLAEDGIDAQGLRSKALSGVPLDEVDLIVTVAPAAQLPRLPAGTRRVDWPLPDPSSAPPEERMEAYRATRDELARRIRGLLG